MAISSAVCNSFKVEILKAVHNFTASSGNTFNLALYTSSASLGAGTTAYASTNEISNTSGSAYTAGGKALTSVTPVLSSSTAVCDFGDIEPTDKVADCPAKIYATSVTSEPTDEVVESPVNVNERSDLVLTEPTLEVEL